MGKFKRQIKGIEKIKKGFTLLELTVSISLFAVFSLFVIDFYVKISDIYLSSISARSVQHNLRVSMESVSRYIKQAREINELDTVNSRLSLRTRDDLGVDHTVLFSKECENDPFSRSEFSCGGVSSRIGVLKIKINGDPLEPLTSTDLNITEFKIEPSPAIPLILNITLKAQVEQGKGQSWERGAGGEGFIEMTSAIGMKGQYY